MLEDILKRPDVSKFIDELKKSNIFHLRDQLTYSYHDISMSYELGLYLFYDALLKYYLIVQVDSYLGDFLEQIQKLYRKLDVVEDIQIGIHKLICNELMDKLHITDSSLEDNRQTVISIAYDRYIRNGYFIHGFSSSYYHVVRDNGFIPEEYENYYDRFQKINAMFHKYNISTVFTKNFAEKKVFFTDDIVMGCYYSMCSPMFFYQFLLNQRLLGKRVSEEDYWYDRYEVFENALKRFMSNHLFSEKDKQFILDLFYDEWKLLHRRKRKICLLLIERSKLLEQDVSLDEFINDKASVYDIIDRMLSSKYNHITYDKKIPVSDMKLITMEHFYEKKITLLENGKIENYKEPDKSIGQDFLNAYGNVSLFLLLGSLLISLGVIFTIISLFRG